MISALIFAGGVGSRMKSKEIPKQFLLVEGKPIIIHTLEHFSNHNMVDNIVVVCLESWIDELKKEIENDKAFIKKMEDKEEMEKFAREKYYLKKENEDIYIIENQDSIKKEDKR